MQALKSLISLRNYCKEYDWPRLPQWNHWIYSKHPIAVACVKKIAGRYFIDLSAFEEHVKNTSLEG